MAPYQQAPKYRPIGIRASLLRIHSDLLTIHRRVETWRAYFPEQLTPLEKMVIALEDRRFMYHSGVDLMSGLREVAWALTFRRHGGASTIDMQFVRTATGYKEHTIFRKLYEILLASLIQYRYNKVVILRSYLRCAFFGSHLIGSDRAALMMFSKQADDLSLDEAAFIASMLVYPRPLSGNTTWQSRVRRRADYGMAVYVANKKRFDEIPS